MTARRLSRNTLTLLVSNLGGAILLFALSALIGRALGSAGLGVYAVVLAWVYPLSLGVEFGLTTLMTREVGAALHHIPAYMHAITRARLLIGVPLMIAFVFAAPLLSRDPSVITGLQVAAPLLIIQPFYSQFTTAFKAHGRMGLIPLLNLGMIGLQVIFTALVLAAGGDVIHALIVNTVTSAGQLVAAWGIYARGAYSTEALSLRLQQESPLKRARHEDTAPFTGLSTRQPDPLRVWRQKLEVSPVSVSQVHPAIGGEASLRQLLRAALPFALAAIFAAVQSRILFILLEQFAAPSETGFFSAANRFAEGARLIPNALFGALFPSLAALAAAPALLRLTFRRAQSALIAFGVAAGLGFTLLAPPLLTLVFGAEFAPAAPALVLLGWSLPFMALRGARTIYWYAHSGEGMVNRVNALAVILIVLLGIGLIPMYGAGGAALALLITETAAAVILYGVRA